MGRKTVPLTQKTWDHEQAALHWYPHELVAFQSKGNKQSDSTELHFCYFLVSILQPLTPDLWKMHVNGLQINIKLQKCFESTGESMKQTYVWKLKEGKLGDKEEEKECFNQYLKLITYLTKLRGCQKYLIFERKKKCLC